MLISGHLNLQGTEKTLQLAAVNRYLRRLQHEQLRSLVLGKGDCPGFYSQTLEDDAGQPAIVLTRATAEEVRQWKAADLARKAEAITEAAGAPLFCISKCRFGMNPKLISRFMSGRRIN